MSRSTTFIRRSRGVFHRLMTHVPLPCQCSLVFPSSSVMPIVLGVVLDGVLGLQQRRRGCTRSRSPDLLTHNNNKDSGFRRIFFWYADRRQGRAAGHARTQVRAMRDCNSALLHAI